MLKKLDEPVDMEAFRNQLEDLLARSRTGYKSIIPEGREDEFPNLVFQEQLATVLA